jgi:hypothetical protein
MDQTVRRPANPAQPDAILAKTQCCIGGVFNAEKRHRCERGGLLAAVTAPEAKPVAEGSRRLKADHVRECMGSAEQGISAPNAHEFDPFAQNGGAENLN